jgi:RNA polymerase sigma-70 factor, ECF subfamily
MKTEKLMTSQESYLIMNAQKGDAAAFEELIYRYDKNVLSIALRFVKNNDDAKDIYQEVFLRVFRGLKNFKFKSEFSTWLYRITTNVCLTYKQKQKKHSYVPIDNSDEDNGENIESFEDENSFTPERIFNDSEISQQVNKALENLSSRQKMIFILKHYEGYKIKEIADIINVGEGTVKKYLFEAVHKLREELQEYYE